MVIDRDWKNFKCEDCGCDIRNANYKYIFLGYHINDSKHKKVCFPCFLKNPEYGNLYHRLIIVEFDSNLPHSVIREEDIKADAGNSGHKAPEGASKPVANNKNGISKGEWILITGEILIISLILIGLFCYLKKNKQK